MLASRTLWSLDSLLPSGERNDIAGCFGRTATAAPGRLDHRLCNETVSLSEIAVRFECPTLNPITREFLKREQQMLRHIEAIFRTCLLEACEEDLR